MRRVADQLRICPRIADSACQEVRIVDPKRTQASDSGSFAMLASSPLYLG